MRVGAVFGLFLLSACAANQQAADSPSQSSRSNQQPQQTIQYDINFDGIDDESLQDRLQAVSSAQQSTSKPPASMLVLRGRGQKDIPVLEKALRGLGYFEGVVESSVRRNQPDEEGNPPKTDATIMFDVNPGPQFTFGVLQLEIGAGGDFNLPSLRNIGFRRGEPALSSVVIATERAVLNKIRDQGYPFAQIGDRDAIVDFETRLMDVLLRFEPGPKTPIGPVNITGIDGIDPDFIDGRVSIETGDQFSPASLDEVRQRLIQTGLFSTVRVITDSAPDANGQLPVTFAATQRKHRSIGGGISYRTDEGPGARVFWEHRNILGAGERLRAEIEANQIREEATLRLRKPDFLAVDQALIGNATAKREDTDAFESESLEAALGLERILTPNITGSLGVAYRYVDITDSDGQQKFGLFSIPAGLGMDYSDNFLDPTKGWRMRLDSAPFVDTLGIGRNFWRSQATATRYFRFFNEPRTVLALRGSVGTLFGATRSEVPADERFYSGGGGSIRGIGYQLAGELDEDNDPIGGISLLEFGSEIRVKAFGDIESVVFLDGGTVYSQAYPDGSEDLRYGTGVGLRYISPIGPLRFDLGFPLDRRKDIDDAFQFYISIGQAF